LKIKNIKIIPIEYHDTKEDYEWGKGTQEIKNAIGEPVNIVFFGSDYRNAGKEELWSESVISYYDRGKIPISSSQINKDSMKYWEYLPSIVKPYYVKKILIIGSESTGKTTMVKTLAEHFNTNYVEEYGRIACEGILNYEALTNDFYIETLINHKKEILDKCQSSNKLLFVDTCALTTGYYNKILSNDFKIQNLAWFIHKNTEWGLVLFLEPTNRFVQDGTRSKMIESKRDHYSNDLKNYYNFGNVKFKTISSNNYEERFLEAKEYILDLINRKVD